MNNIQNIYNKVSSSSKVLMLSALLCASSSVLAQEQVLKAESSTARVNQSLELLSTWQRKAALP